MATAGLASLANDAIQNSVKVTERAMKDIRRRVDELGDLKQEAVHRMRRRPLRAAGAALGVGLVLGVAFGWAALRGRRRR
jgi:hypothetical protein